MWTHFEEKNIQAKRETKKNLPYRDFPVLWKVGGGCWSFSEHGSKPCQKKTTFLKPYFIFKVKFVKNDVYKLCNLMFFFVKQKKN